MRMSSHFSLGRGILLTNNVESTVYKIKKGRCSSLYNITRGGEEEEWEELHHCEGRGGGGVGGSSPLCCFSSFSKLYFLHNAIMYFRYQLHGDYTVVSKVRNYRFPSIRKTY